MRHTDFDEHSKVIDSRDVIAKLEELQSERDTLVEAWNELKEQFAELSAEKHPSGEDQDNEELAGQMSGAEQDVIDWDESEDGQELKALIALQNDCDYGDWHHGETLIRDSYFEDYAKELAEDCGMIKDENTWPNRCIDWEQAADELKQDYTSVEYHGVEYWIRA